MQSNEFRVGNYIYKKIHKKDTPLDIVAVLSIDGAFDVLDVKNIDGYITEKCPLKDFERIPLTEEWLLKFGFLKIENINCWVKNWGRNGAEFVKFDDYYKLFSYQLGNANYRVIEYGVHQLQNIFYAITNEELIIK